MIVIGILDIKLVGDVDIMFRVCYIGTLNIFYGARVTGEYRDG